MIRTVSLACLIPWSVLALACGSLPKVSGAPAVPGQSKDVLVGEVTPFAGYLRVEALAPGRSRVLYVRDTETCRAMAESGEEVALISVGLLGRFEDEESACDVVGTESLRELRDSRSIGDDVTAVVPNDADCNAIAAKGESFMLYEVSREPVFTLRSGEQHCVVRGFIRIQG